MTAERNLSTERFAYGGVAVLKIAPSGGFSVFPVLPLGSEASSKLGSIAVDSTGNVYANVFDVESDRASVRKITPDGVLSSFPAELDPAWATRGLSILGLDAADHALIRGGDDLIRRVNPLGQVVSSFKDPGVRSVPIGLSHTTPRSQLTSHRWLIRGVTRFTRANAWPSTSEKCVSLRRCASL